jgi:hypothetical protein
MPLYFGCLDTDLEFSPLTSERIAKKGHGRFVARDRWSDWIRVSKIPPVIAYTFGLYWTQREISCERNWAFFVEDVPLSQHPTHLNPAPVVPTLLVQLR